MRRYYVVNGVAFDDVKEAAEAAETLCVHIQPVAASDELSAVAIASALLGIDGSSVRQPRNSS